MPKLGGDPLSAPPANIALPLEVRSSKFKNIGWAILAITLGIPLIPLAATLCIMPVVYILGGVWSPLNTALAVVFLFFGPLMLTMTVQSFLSGFVALSDARRPGPALTIDAEGLTDHRCAVRIAWSDIARVQPLYSNSGVLGLRLLLKAQIAGRASRFRQGAAGLSFRRIRQPHHRLALACLEPESPILLSVIAHRAHDSGAEIDWSVGWI